MGNGQKNVAVREQKITDRKLLIKIISVRVSMVWNRALRTAGERLAPKEGLWTAGGCLEGTPACQKPKNMINAKNTRIIVEKYGYQCVFTKFEYSD